MSRRLRKLIKEFSFSEDHRRELTFGANVRLNPETNVIQLQADADGNYPTTADLFVKTRLTNPNTVKRWIGFMADVSNKENAHGVVVTAVKYRLSTDGVNQFYWNGSLWHSASSGQWSTEAEVSANISTFPASPQSMQVIVNLSTTDAHYTPEVSRVKILWESDIEFQEDYIARSLVPALRNELRPISDHDVKMGTSAAAIDLTLVETTYNIVGIDSVYNLTDDPARQTDLFGSYNPTTKTVTLTSSVAAGKIVRVRFIYAPVIAIDTSADYKEFAKIPVLVIESIKLVNESRINIGDHVIDKTTGQGWQLKNGFQADIDLHGKWICDKTKDVDRFAGQIKAFFRDRLLRSVGQDENYRVRILDEYDHQSTPLQSELRSGQFRARISNAVFYEQDAAPVTAVLHLRVTGGNAKFTV